MDKNGTGRTLNIDEWSAGGNKITPENVVDIFRSIIPHIGTNINIIRRNINMYPSYLVSGLRTASLLRSLQYASSNIPNMNGEIGFSGAQSDFMKLKVIESTVIPEDTMYIACKAPNNQLELSFMVDLIFKPLYVIKEITDTIN